MYITHIMDITHYLRIVYITHILNIFFIYIKMVNKYQKQRKTPKKST